MPNGWLAGKLIKPSPPTEWFERVKEQLEFLGRIAFPKCSVEMDVFYYDTILDTWSTPLFRVV